MKKLLFLLFIFYAFPTFCQNVTFEEFSSNLRLLLEKRKFEEAKVYYLEYRTNLDATSDDMINSIINVGLFSQQKMIDVESTVGCIKRFMNNLSVLYRENPTSIPVEVMDYFSIYLSFLEQINDSYYMDVYRLFKQIWPKINNKNTTTYISILENVSIYTYESSRYNDAIPIFEEIIDLYKKGYTTSSESYVYYSYLGWSYEKIGQMEKAAMCFDNVLIEFPNKDRKDKTLEYINTVKCRFDYAVSLSQFSKCRELGEILIDYYEDKEDHIQDYISVSYELAKIELSTYNTKGISLYENVVKHILTSDVYNEESRRNFILDLYMIYNTFGIADADRKYKEYLNKYQIINVGKYGTETISEHYIDSLQNLIKKNAIIISDIRSYTNAVISLSQYYSSRGQELYGINLIENTIKRYKDNNIEKQDYAILYNTLGTIYSLINSSDRAKENFKTAQQIYEGNGMYNADYIEILCNLGDVYLRLGEYVDAKAYLQEAYELSQTMDAFITDKTRYFQLLQELSFFYRSINNENESLLYNSMILDDISEHGLFDLEKTFLSMRVNILMHFNRYKDAYDLLKKIGIDFYEQNDEWWTPFDVKFFNNDGTCEKELEKTWHSELTTIQRLYSSFPIAELNNYWDIIGGNLNAAFSSTLYKFNTPSLRNLTYNNILLTKNLQLELSKYKRAKPEELLTNENFNDIIDAIGNVDKIKNSLREKEVAIEFLIINVHTAYKDYVNKYGALILRKDMEAPVFVELCVCDTLDQLVYKNTTGNVEDYVEKIYDIKNNMIYNLIWKSLEKEIPLNSTVYVSGCGSILYINLLAISTGKERLNELYDIHNLSSTSCINSIRNNSCIYKSASVFGGIDYNTAMDIMATKAAKYSHDDTSENYVLCRGINERGSWGNLKYSLEEANNLANIFSIRGLSTTKYIKSDASEEAFKSLSGSSPDIIHLSTHGFYYQPYMHSFHTDYSNSYFSFENNDKLNFNGLLFSGANNAWRNNKYQDNVDDGILTAREVYSLDLSNTSLLTLSACQTGLGETNNIDGNEGLFKAFKVAGVKEIIMTLWNISDEATSIIMVQFYKNLLDIQNPRSALLKTITDIQKDMPDPYYWAPFIIVE